MLEVTPEIRSLVRDGAAIETVIAAARAAGAMTLREAGVKKALAGLTTLDEVQRVLPQG
jgi:type II secretory ATPase GspE/PulE/Tfp pilus assembly ATPase PilB-like protein